MQLLPWPAYSPDMSPIEHLWDLVGRRLVRDPRTKDSKEELMLRIQAIRNSFPQADIQNLFDSMLRRTIEKYILETEAHKGNFEYKRRNFQPWDVDESRVESPPFSYHAPIRRPTYSFGFVDFREQKIKIAYGVSKRFVCCMEPDITNNPEVTKELLGPREFIKSRRFEMSEKQHGYHSERGVHPFGMDPYSVEKLNRRSSFMIEDILTPKSRLEGLCLPTGTAPSRAAALAASPYYQLYGLGPSYLCQQPQQHFLGKPLDANPLLLSAGKCTLYFENSLV
ncbi:brain-specific homeobox [Trichonephila clavipes]|nr:brain-specific homeobox [Trichonephila clavipes]